MTCVSESRTHRTPDDVVTTGQRPPGVKDIDEAQSDRNDREVCSQDLFFEVCKQEGLDLIGDPNRVFASFDPGTGTLAVYSKNPDWVSTLIHQPANNLVALRWAQEEGASFSVCGERVLCVLKDLVAQGSSYGDAAVRALLKLYEREAESNRQPGST